MDPFSMVVAIVFLTMVGGTIQRYLLLRARMADRHARNGDESLRRAIDELRAQVAALKQHESEAILSFDSTLQTLEARVKHLERKALDEGTASRTSLGAAASPVVQEPEPVTVTGGASGVRPAA